MIFMYGGNVKSWEPNKLVQDDEDIAYQPTDKEGKKLATSLTMYLRLLMWRVKMDKTQPARIIHVPGELPRFGCTMRPIHPPQE